MSRLGQVLTPGSLDALRICVRGDLLLRVGLLCLGHFEKLDRLAEVQRCQVKLTQAQVENAEVVEVVLGVHLPALGVE